MGPAAPMDTSCMHVKGRVLLHHLHCGQWPPGNIDDRGNMIQNSRNQVLLDGAFNWVRAARDLANS